VIALSAVRFGHIPGELALATSVQAHCHLNADLIARGSPLATGDTNPELYRNATIRINCFLRPQNAVTLPALAEFLFVDPSPHLLDYDERWLVSQS